MSTLSPAERSVLVHATRAALSGPDFIASAREALDGAPLPDGWPIAVAAGWPGLLVDEALGGAGLGAAEALLVSRELGRVLAGVPLFGHLTATALLGGLASRSSAMTPSLAADLADAGRRAVWLPTRPEDDGRLSADPVSGPHRLPGPRLDADGRVSATVAWVPDAPGADLLVFPATDGDGGRRVAVVDASEARVEEVPSYDATRRLAHVAVERAPATLVSVPVGANEACWALAQSLLGAESLGAAERLLEISVEHAKRRFAFGRPIGSFQAIKHQLVEVLRRLENARTLMARAGTALDEAARDAYVSAGALRFCAGEALDFASRTAIAVHGGMGATWEHPAALYFRRAQVARRLLAGHGATATEVGRRLLIAAA